MNGRGDWVPRPTECQTLLVSPTQGIVGAVGQQPGLTLPWGRRWRSRLLNTNWIEMKQKFKECVEGWREGWSSGPRETQRQLSEWSQVLECYWEWRLQGFPFGLPTREGGSELSTGAWVHVVSTEGIWTLFRRCVFLSQLCLLGVQCWTVPSPCWTLVLSLVNLSL